MTTAALSAPLTLRLHPGDSVVIARADLAPGTSLPGEGTTVRDAIPIGHKVATRAIARGEPVRRYGQIIGFATARHRAGRARPHPQPGHGRLRARLRVLDARRRPRPTSSPAATFQGILRADGRVATRNYIGILTSVNCSATVAGYIADAFKRRSFTGDGPARRLPERRRRRGADPQDRLRHGQRRRGIDLLRRTMGGYRAARELRGGRSWSASAARPTRSARSLETQGLKIGRHAPDHDHPGHGRHARRRWSAASRQMREMLPEANRVRAAAGPGLAPDGRRCNAAAPTATPASPPTRRSAPRPTCSCATAAP